MRHLISFSIIFFFLCKAFAQNVGIGTSNPTAKLHINGTLKIANGSQGTGKVLTSDAAGLATWKVPEKSIFKATGFKAAFNVAPNATKVLTDWNRVELDIGANSIFVNAQGDLFVLKDGFYRVAAKVSTIFVDPGDSHNIDLSILVNGVKRATTQFPVPTNDNALDVNFKDVTIFVTSIFKLEAQDKIRIEFKNGETVNTTAQFANYAIDNRLNEFLVEQL